MIGRGVWLWWLVVLASGPVEAGADRHAARVAAAEAAHDGALARWQAGQAPLDEVYRWSVRWQQSARDAGQASAAADHLARMRALQTQVTGQVSSGLAPTAAADAARYYVAEAVVWSGG